MEAFFVQYSEIAKDRHFSWKEEEAMLYFFKKKLGVKSVQATVVKQKSKKFLRLAFLSFSSIFPGMAAIYVGAFLNYETTADLPVPEWVMRAGFTVAGALLILIGLSCTVFSIKRMMERKPFLEVNDNGVVNRLKVFYTEEVPYENIKRAYVKTWMDHDYLAIVLHSREEFLKNHSVFVRWDKLFEGLFGFETIMIDLSDEGKEYIGELVVLIHERIEQIAPFEEGRETKKYL